MRGETMYPGGDPTWNWQAPHEPVSPFEGESPGSPEDRALLAKTLEKKLASADRHAKILAVMKEVGEIITNPHTQIQDVRTYLADNKITAQEIEADEELPRMLEDQVPNYDTVMRLLKPEEQTNHDAAIALEDADLEEVKNGDEAQAA